MQNRFGLKDFVLLVLVAAVGIGVLLTMYQDDRRFEQNAALVAKVNGLEQTLARVERRLAEGVAVATAGSSSAAGREERDASWARDDGTPISWQPPVAFATDPSGQEGFAVGGEIVEVFPQFAKVMPYLAADIYSRQIYELVVESLGAYDPETLVIQGVLAEAWQYDRGGLWLRVKIRDAARFSDGEPVTAEDVEFSWEDFLLNPQLATERARSISDNVADVKVIDEKVVEFEFKEPLYSNLTIAMRGYVLPKHFYERFSETQINAATALVMGSGPFRLASLDPNAQWTPGQDFVLVRNENYWVPAAMPAAERMRYKSISDKTAQLTAYTNGDVDIMEPTAEQFRQMNDRPRWGEQNQNLNWVNMRSGYRFIGWQAGKRNGEVLTPFHDRRVRQAMTHLLDRERMVQEIDAGIGEVATGPNNRKSPAYNHGIEPWAYDLGRARELLAEAGWVDRDGDRVLENERGDEFQFEFTYPAGAATYERMAKYMKDQAARVGIRMTERPLDWSVMQEVLQRRDFDAVSLGWGASAPESDPKQIFHSESIQNQGDNFVQWSSEEADRLIDLGRATLDEGERMKVWQELHRVFHEEQPYTFLTNRPDLRFVKPRIGNVNMYPSGLESAEYFVRPSVGG